MAIAVAVAGVLTMPVASSAQEPAPAQAPAAAPAPARVENRRPALQMMEAVLSRAVLTGAEGLARQLSSGNPNMSFFTGQARARGFVLDGYGVFFHVEIPEMQQSVVFSVTTLERDLAVAQSLDPLIRIVENAPDNATKMAAEQAIKRLQVQFGPPSLGPASQVAPRGAMRSADATSVSNTTTSPVDPDPPVVEPIMRDPNAVYREAIKAAIIEAMLEYSRGLNLQPDEWLSVAASRGDSPLAPDEIVTSSTLVLRIKGSDLALYDADRSRKEEIRKRVEVREF